MGRAFESKPSPERDSIQTLVAVKRDGRWQFVAFQNTRVRPMGQNHLGTLLWLVSDWFWKWCLPKVTSGPCGSQSHETHWTGHLYTEWL